MYRRRNTFERSERTSIGTVLAWLILFVIGAGMIGIFVVVQRRLGNGIFAPASAARSTPLPSVTPTASVTNFAETAQKAYLDGKYLDAIDLYEQALRRKPNDSVWTFQVARLQILTGQAAKAEQRVRRVLQNDANSSNLRAVLCMALDWQGHINDALQECQNAVSLDGNNPIAHAYASEAFTDSGNFVSARASAQRALDLDPNNIDALRNMGYAYEQAGRYNDAVYYYDQVLQQAPNLPHVLNAIGRTYGLMGQLNRAILYFKRVLEVDPKNAEAMDRLGGAYIGLGEFDLARLKLDESIKTDPNRYTAYTRRAQVNFVQRRYEGTVADITQAISITKQISATVTANDLIYLGFAQQNLNNCTSAIATFNNAINMAPGDSSILELATNGLRKCGK